MSSILVHGYIPKIITESAIIPVITDKNRRVNDKGNCMPICLSNKGSKILKAVLRWGPTYSESFPMGNDVKQGGKLSPLLFNIYMGNLTVQLHTKPIGCSLGTTAVNHLIYADYLLLFAPSAKGLHTFD